MPPALRSATSAQRGVEYRAVRVGLVRGPTGGSVKHDVPVEIRVEAELPVQICRVSLRLERAPTRSAPTAH
jgi:hypothetical protein